MFARPHLEENYLTRRLQEHAGNTDIEFGSLNGSARAVVRIAGQEASVGDISTTHRIESVSLKLRNAEGKTLEIHANRRHPRMDWALMALNQGQAPTWNVKVTGMHHEKMSNVDAYGLNLAGEWKLEADGVKSYIQNRPTPPRKLPEKKTDWVWNATRVTDSGRGR